MALLTVMDQGFKEGGVEEVGWGLLKAMKSMGTACDKYGRSASDQS